MGWWSKDILGGDEPLDLIGNFANQCDLEFQYDDNVYPQTYHGYLFTKELVENNIENLKKCAGSDIGNQVLGHLILWTGANVNKDLIKEIIQSCKNDAWSKNDKERKKYTKQLATALKNHKPGTKVELKTKGLFEAIDDHDGPGLINIIPQTSP